MRAQPTADALVQVITLFVVQSPASPAVKALIVSNPAFKKVADDAIRTLFKSGEIQKIYAKWFLSPILPKSVKLNAPMSDVLKKVIAKPTDSGNPGDY